MFAAIPPQPERQSVVTVQQVPQVPAPRQQIERQRRPEELDALAKELSNLGTQYDVARHMMWLYCVPVTANITNCVVSSVARCQGARRG